MSVATLTILIPTFFVVSLTPGLCMTLSMTLGMTIGVRRALWMMPGELLGVAIVAAASIIGVAALVLQYPTLFTVVKIIGGIYLGYLGIQLWLSKGKMALQTGQPANATVSPWALAVQGFITAVANPKGWAFCIALLPPFIDQNRPFMNQLLILLGVILAIEFSCLILYASGGRTLNYLLQKQGNVRLINRIAGTSMILVGIWLGVA
jgi:threonine/homoserine/homoserine lactone efflux protein